MLVQPSVNLFKLLLLIDRQLTFVAKQARLGDDASEQPVVFTVAADNKAQKH